MLQGRLGKQYKVRALKESDHPQLQIFCNKCAELGYENNKDFHNMKLDKMSWPYGQYFVAVDDEKIFSVAGVHKFPEMGENAYRCLFRGAQLPGYTPIWSLNLFESIIHLGYLLYAQIEFVQQFDPNAKFYISTNIDNPSAGKSSKLNKIVMPKLVKKGYCSLVKEDIILYNTRQNIWEVNVPLYMKNRKLALQDPPTIPNFDTILMH